MGGVVGEVGHGELLGVRKGRDGKGREGGVRKRFHWLFPTASECGRLREAVRW